MVPAAELGFALQTAIKRDVNSEGFFLSMLVLDFALGVIPTSCTVVNVRSQIEMFQSRIKLVAFGGYAERQTISFNLFRSLYFR